jgi:hypothetical protein
MMKNPFINALCASAYIALVATFIYHIPNTVDHMEGPLSIVLFLSLFVFSVATMAFLFFYQPVRLLIGGEKERAVSFFLKMILYFGLITGVLFSITLLFLAGSGM